VLIPWAVTVVIVMSDIAVLLNVQVSTYRQSFCCLPVSLIFLLFVIYQSLTVLLYIELPDTFIPITLTLKDREFTNSLNDRNSDDYQTLSREIINDVSYTIVITKLN
jgi:hypothetical protein